jgi:putative ABC transport system permease protein
MSILALTWKSLKNRWGTAALTISAIAISVTLLLGVERIRDGAQSSFENTISGTDLIVGPRTGDVQLLLYSVFRIGAPTTTLSWESYKTIAALPDVAWTVPIELGDSHRGYRVMGTNNDYFKLYLYGNRQPLEFTEGGPFSDPFDAVLGWEAARELRYGIGREISVTHGISDAALQEHEHKPFRVVGILKRTGTPVDRTVHISLEGITALHVDWQTGAAPSPDKEVSVEEIRKMDLTPKSITAMFVGLKSKIGLLRMHRFVNMYQPEALSAIIPGATLGQLWRTIGVAETALRAVSAFVVLAGLLGMLTAILTTLNERRREMAILRSVGARPFHVFAMLVSEALYLTVLGCVVGVGLLYLALTVAQPLIERGFGLFIPVKPLALFDWMVLGAIVLAASAAGCIPAWRAYRNALADGLTIRL